MIKFINKYESVIVVTLFFAIPGLPIIDLIIKHINKFH